ncbi:HNH endonuclease [Roseiarcus fermentans]|uniref:HNH endonuclease n=1 Tax=Roseiarcus fermentans TaxID=1473586 RepID=A0A366EMY9_9HYPH|nr:HNH endonuclease [Roseiarcus fermentans]RBP03802.1 HNH endonuclease [Roseiarcus fermentans]
MADDGLVALDRLREVLAYDPATGSWTWLVTNSNRARAGSLAGWAADGYVNIKVDGRVYRAHVLAWFYMTGSWPETHVDHRDRDRSNNRWRNLREATHSQNLSNCKVRKDNASGARGVSWDVGHGKWRAYGNVDGKRHNIGYFEKKDDAVAARRRWAESSFGEFAGAF